VTHGFVKKGGGDMRHILISCHLPIHTVVSARYLLLYQLNCMLIWRTQNVEPEAYNLDHQAAILVHQASNVAGPLLGKRLYRFVPMTGE